MDTRLRRLEKIAKSNCNINSVENYIRELKRLNLYSSDDHVNLYYSCGLLEPLRNYIFQRISKFIYVQSYRNWAGRDEYRELSLRPDSESELTDWEKVIDVAHYKSVENTAIKLASGFIEEFDKLNQTPIELQFLTKYQVDLDIVIDGNYQWMVDEYLIHLFVEAHINSRTNIYKNTPPIPFYMLDSTFGFNELEVLVWNQIVNSAGGILYEGTSETEAQRAFDQELEEILECVRSDFDTSNPSNYCAENPEECQESCGSVRWFENGELEVRSP